MIRFFLVDADDFCDENNDLATILRLKKSVPNLKLNLFTIPGKCSMTFLEDMRRVDWIQMIPHGHIHSTSRECQNWSYDVANYHLKSLEKEGWIRGWRSPGWQTSAGLYYALADRGWWVAAQEYDRERIPNGLRTYYLDAPYKIHGHIGHYGVGAHNNNALEYIFDEIASLQGEFGFIDDLWK